MSAYTPETFNVGDLISKAKQAEKEFAKLDQAQVDKIFLRIAHEADKNRLPLAMLAVEETKMGLVEDKVLKNGLAAELIRHRYKDSVTCGVIQTNKIEGITKIATPVGTVVCITPTTNPTSTAIAKSMFLAKTRNAGIFLPHPRAAKCTAEAVRVCHDAGVAAGAPQNWVQCAPKPTLELSSAIMEHPKVNLILATGGPGMVKASYSTGHPAIGVGSGNAPVLVDETAGLDQACGSIVLGKTFDNGMICASEQSVVVVDDIYEKFKARLEERGVCFLYGEDRDKLAKFLVRDGRINVDVVGQSARTIARLIGVTVPKQTVVLAAEETLVGPDVPLSYEKLSPILALYRANNFAAAVDLCEKLALHGGIGHTAGIYSENEARLELFAARMPVGRILANMPTSLSAIGTEFNSAIDPSFTLGVGTLAGSSTNENVGPMHLLNIKTLALRQDHIEWYRNPPDIYYNRGCLEEALNDCARPLKGGDDRMTRCLIVTDKVMGIMGYVDRLKDALVEKGFVVSIFDDVNPDPDLATVRKGIQACESFKPDIMVCLGGGSPMDAGKFIRVLYECPQLSLEDAAARFLELRKRTCPFPVLGSKIKKVVCVPTTSGTASEVTPFSVITDDDGMKHPLFSYNLTPDIAVIDSSFCEQLPKGLVAFAGIDAVTHAVEAYVSVVANEFTEGHCLRALKLLTENLVESYDKGTLKAREAVHHGATLAGLAFSNSFLGIAHSLAHKVGAAFHLPHGLTCGILLPHVIRYNASKTPTRMGIYPGYDHPKALERYAEIARYLHLGGNTEVDQMEAFIAKLYELYGKMNVPLTFQAAGVSEEAFLENLDGIALKAFDDQCTPANPRFPLVAELKEILKVAYYGPEEYEYVEEASEGSVVSLE